MVSDSRVFKISNSLGKFGHQVIVYCLHRDGLPINVKHQFFTIIRVKMFNLQRFSKIFYILKYFIYFSKVFSKSKDFDLIICNDFITLPIGVFIKQFTNIKVIYDCHEYEAHVNEISKLQSIFIYTFEKILIKFVDQVITVSNSISKSYANDYNIQPPKVIRNTCYFYDDFPPNLLLAKLKIKNNPVIFLYQGAFMDGRGIETIINEFKAPEINRIVVFIGDGPLTKFVKYYAKIYPSIYYIKSVPFSELKSYTSYAHFGFCLIEDTCLSYRYCLPNKFFEYLMYRTPVICSNLPELSMFVNKYNLGFTVDDSGILNLAHTLDCLSHTISHRLMNNIKKFNNIYNWENEEKKLLKLDVFK
jgi:glycosyltransferase involved in cell wall biosynthesis